MLAQGPGLEQAGSDVPGNETRMHDQEFGAPALSTAAPDSGRATD